MKATSLPNLNHEPTSYHNFFTFFEDPNHHDDTTLHKRPNIDHSQVSEPSETSPFKDILSPFVSFNESNENHYPVGGFFCERDQKDQTLPRRPPSPARSSETTVSVGSNPFSGSVGARSEGPNVTQLRGNQTLPSMSSVGSYQSSGNVGGRSAGPNFSQLQLPQDTEKHYPPSPNDEVWRLTNIAKDGPFHNRLVFENIKTVKDFLTRCCINPKSLQNILGAGKIWKSTVAHAHTCKIMRLYFQIGSGKKSGVVFNAAGQVMGLISECCYVPLDELSEDQKAEANKLVVIAHEHMGDVKTFDDETSLHSHLQLLNDACPSYSPMLECPSHYNCEPLHAHYGHDHTQPSSSSHNHQVVPFHLPEAANPSTIPSAVKDHLTWFFLDPQSLQNILGAAQMREAIVDHARTFILDKSLHLYFPIGSEKKYGVVFNVVGQVMGLISDCCYVPLDKLSEDQKGVANNLVVSALEHMEEVMSFANETHLHSQLQLHNDASPQTHPG